MQTTKVVDPLDQLGNEQIFFGATVKYKRSLINNDSGLNQKHVDEIIEEVVIVGKEETNLKKRVNFIRRNSSKLSG